MHGYATSQGSSLGDKHVRPPWWPSTGALSWRAWPSWLTPQEQPIAAKEIEAPETIFRVTESPVPCPAISAAITSRSMCFTDGERICGFSRSRSLTPRRAAHLRRYDGSFSISGRRTPAIFDESSRVPGVLRSGSRSPRTRRRSARFEPAHGGGRAPAHRAGELIGRFQPALVPIKATHPGCTRDTRSNRIPRGGRFLPGDDRAECASARSR